MSRKRSYPAAKPSSNRKSTLRRANGGPWGYRSASVGLRRVSALVGDWQACVLCRRPDGLRRHLAQRYKVLGRRAAMGAFVPIRQYLGDNRWFSPADLDAMGKAFTTALGKLGLNDRSDPLVEMVACRIVRAAMSRRARSDQAVRDRSRRRRRCQRRA